MPGKPLIIRLQSVPHPWWAHRTFNTFPKHKPTIPTQNLPWERDGSSQSPGMTLLVTAKLVLTLSGTKTNITTTKKASDVSFRKFFTWKILSAGDQTLKDPLLGQEECSPSCCLHTLESQKPSHERRAPSEVTLNHNLPKPGSIKITLCVNRICWQKSYSSTWHCSSSEEEEKHQKGEVSSAVPWDSPVSAQFGESRAKQSQDQFVVPFGDQKGQRWGWWSVGTWGMIPSALEEMWAVWISSQLTPTQLWEESSAPREALKAEFSTAWEGLQLQTMPHSGRNSRGSFSHWMLFVNCTSKIKWSDLFLSACDGHPSILLFSSIFSCRFLIRAISDR